MKTFLVTDNNSEVMSFWNLRLRAVARLLCVFCFSAADLKGDWAEDHLVPFDYTADYGSGYAQALKEQVLLAPATCARMLVLPSEEGEYTISTYSKTVDSTKRDYLTYVAANRNIWYEREYRSKEPVPIKRVDVEIPPSLALAVCTAWKEMLSRARPYDQEPPFIRLDGRDVVFSVDDVTVQGALPLKGGKHTETLHQIGKLLIAYCKAKDSKRPAIAAQIEHAANLLAEDLKKRDGVKK